MVAQPFGYLDLVFDFEQNFPVREKSVLWFANVINFTLPICLSLLQENSTFRLEYISTNFGNVLPNSMFTTQELNEGINFTAVPGKNA